jgi:hypothetical protein
MSDWRNFLDARGRQSAYCASSYHSEVFKLSLQFCSLAQNRSAGVAQIVQFEPLPDQNLLEELRRMD